MLLGEGSGQYAPDAVMLGALELLVNKVFPPQRAGKKITLRMSPSMRAAFAHCLFIVACNFDAIPFLAWLLSARQHRN